MTNPLDDDRVDEYLWKPSASPDSDVQALERRLAVLRFDPAGRPLVVPRRRLVEHRTGHRLLGLAAAAAIVLAAGWLLAQWRWSWPEGRAWPVVSSTAAASDELAVGSPLDVDPGVEARVHVARIGTMAIAGGARVTLQSTQGERHRLHLERGTVRVAVWAPPGSVVIQTPSGEVIDLGCRFELTVDGARSAVAVQSGWVQLANVLGESLIPEGAVSEMRSGVAPAVPVFADAGAPFLAAVRMLEAGDDAGRGAALDRVVALARPRDGLTLLKLIQRGVPGLDRLAARAAELAPPPAGVSPGRVARGDRADLERWLESLPLPPPKNWLRNWRDALPEWLGGGLR